MKHIVPRLLALAALLLAQTAAQAAPPATLTLSYEASRNGQLFARVTETFSQAQGKYRIESVTKGVGLYALLGERRMLSTGEVTADGLKPLHFESHQGDNPKRALYADFDWPGRLLKLQAKGKASTAKLEPGTQDITSLMYQFMFVQPRGETFQLPVTTGRKLKRYQYRVTAHDEALQVPAGRYRTIHLQDGSTEADDDHKELWLGAESFYLPVKLVMRDEKGVVIEQVLTEIKTGPAQ